MIKYKSYSIPYGNIINTAVPTSLTRNKPIGPAARESVNIRFVIYFFVLLVLIICRLRVIGYGVTLLVTPPQAGNGGTAERIAELAER